MKSALFLGRLNNLSSEQQLSVLYLIRVQKTILYMMKHSTLLPRNLQWEIKQINIVLKWNNDVTEYEYMD